MLADLETTVLFTGRHTWFFHKVTKLFGERTDKEGKTHRLPSWGGGGVGTDVLLDLGSSHCQR